MSEEVSFFRCNGRDGKVHVERQRVSLLTTGLVLDALFAVPVALCGAKGRCMRYQYTGRGAFDDEELCSRCVRSTPEEDRCKLFAEVP